MKKPLPDTAFIREVCRKKWDSGSFLRRAEAFPFRIPLSASINQIDANEAGRWKEGLVQKSHLGYRLEMKATNFKVVGYQEVPIAAYLDTLEDVIRFLGVKDDYERFQETLGHPETIRLGLTDWVMANPFKAIQCLPDWRHLTSVVQWLIDNPCRNIYIRQVAIPGVHTKFISSHSTVIESLFKAASPDSVLEVGKTFEKRFGFVERDPDIRLRLLDPKFRKTNYISDMRVPSQQLTEMCLPIKRVYVTENLLNFLTFPETSNSIVIFGEGYGFELWRKMTWLNDVKIIYWGDLDTHGFKILNQLKGLFPHVKSIMMTQEVLDEYSNFLVDEKTASHVPLANLNEDERALYSKFLPGGPYAYKRLEQELIPYDAALKSLREFDEHESLMEISDLVMPLSNTN